MGHEGPRRVNVENIPTAAGNGNSKSETGFSHLPPRWVAPVGGPPEHAVVSAQARSGALASLASGCTLQWGGAGRGSWGHPPPRLNRGPSSNGRARGALSKRRGLKGRRILERGGLARGVPGMAIRGRSKLEGGRWGSILKMVLSANDP